MGIVGIREIRMNGEGFAFLVWHRLNCVSDSDDHSLCLSLWSAGVFRDFDAVVCAHFDAVRSALDSLEIK